MEADMQILNRQFLMTEVVFSTCLFRPPTSIVSNGVLGPAFPLDSGRAIR